MCVWLTYVEGKQTAEAYEAVCPSMPHMLIPVLWHQASSEAGWLPLASCGDLGKPDPAGHNNKHRLRPGGGPGVHKAMWAGVPPMYHAPRKGKCGKKVSIIIDSINNLFPYGNLANTWVSSDIYCTRDSVFIWKKF